MDDSSSNHNNSSLPPRTQAERLALQQRRMRADHAKTQRQLHETITKHHKMIQELSKGNGSLREELTKADTSTFNATDQEKLSRMQGEVDQLEMKIEYERMRRADLQNRHALCRVDTLKTRKSMGGVNITSERADQVEKQVKVLENRLDQALVKFNEALSTNKSLRGQIDSLREERQVFQRIYKKLEMELYERKKAMADKIERANLDYEERDQLKQELEARKAAAEEDRQLCQESFLQLDKVLEQLKATAQEQKRQQLAQMSLTNTSGGGGAAAGGHGHPNASGGGLNGSMGGPKSALKKEGTSPTGGPGANTGAGANGVRVLNQSRGADGSALGETESRAGQNNEEDEHDLQTIVDDLKALTGHQDLRLLLDNFVKSEELNFSTYNFINNLQSQQEQLEQEITALEGDLAAHRGDVERRKAIRELELDLANTEAQQEKLTTETARQKQVLSQVHALTGDLFEKLECDQASAVADYGTTEVSDLNLLGFLGLIERRSTALLFKYQAVGGSSGIAQQQLMQPPANAASSGANADAAGGENDSNAQSTRSDDQEGAGGGATAGVTGLDAGATSMALAPTTSTVAISPSSPNRFIGVGPAAQTANVTAPKIIKHITLPTTNAGEVGAGDTYDTDTAAGGGREEILSHEEMRQRVEQRMQRRAEREERAGKAGKGRKIKR